MTVEKFQGEIETLKKFFPLYCKAKHNFQDTKTYDIAYKNEISQFSICLCKECHELLQYSLLKLQECPHEIKPRCRNCPNPCYEKKEWKALAKLMRYSGLQLGILKIKNFSKKFKI